jgi:SAM-dependent methyltransferase
MTEVDNKQIYDANWANWVLMKEVGPMSRHARRLIFNSLKGLSFDSVLDVGCGPGVFLSEILKRYPHLKGAGADISQTGLEIAGKRLPGMPFYQCDITSAPPPGKYDLITMVDVAEHLPDDLSAFKNVRQVCEKFLVICTLEGRMRPFESEVGHVRNYAPGELHAKLEQSGFEMVSYLNWGWPMYSPLYRNISGAVSAHTKELTWFRRLLGNLTYFFLMLNLPGKGDVVIAVAKPK